VPWFVGQFCPILGQIRLCLGVSDRRAGHLARGLLDSGTGPNILYNMVTYGLFFESVLNNDNYTNNINGFPASRPLAPANIIPA
jgi:hypothetical protein